MKKTVITVSALSLLLALSLILILINVQHTKNRVEAVLAEFAKFDESKGAFPKLKQLESVCGSACFVTTKQECDPDLCAVTLGFNNKWASSFALAPEVSLQGNVNVSDDVFYGFMLEYSLRRRHSKPVFAVVSIVRERPAPHVPIETRWERDIQWRDGTGTAVTLHLSAADKEKQCALALNLKCLEMGNRCKTSAELAPCAASQSVLAR